MVEGQSDETIDTPYSKSIASKCKLSPEEENEQLHGIVAEQTLRIEKLTGLLNDEEDAKNDALEKLKMNKMDLLNTVKIIVDSALV